VTPKTSNGNTAGGTVQFYGDTGSPVDCQNAPAGSVPVASDGTATCVTTYASAGTYDVWATYSGDANFARSQSDGPATVTVAAVPPTPAAPAPSAAAPPKAPAAPVPGSGTSTIGKAVSKRGSDMVTLPIKCAARGASCTVREAVTTTVTVRQHGKRVHKTIVLGNGHVTIAAGRFHALKVSLSQAGRRLLTTHRHLATKVRVASHYHGAIRTSVTKLTMRAAPRKRRA
jgi:hypothetical protein